MMVFLLLVSIAVFALVAAHFYALKASRGSRQRQTASTLVFSSLNAAEQALRHEFWRNQSKPLAPVEDSPGFRMALSDVYEPDGMQNLKRVTCSVYWEEAGTTREFRSHLEIYRGR